MPKVSIVIVNYNHGKYLDERIQTFLDQTYQDFELIIVDNGSTDNSTEVINKYKGDPRVKGQFYSENILPFKRWNDAIEIVQGEYLLISGADDSCHSTLLERLVPILDNNPSVGFAYTQSLEIDSEGKILCSCKVYSDEFDEERWSKDFVDDGNNEINYLFIGGGCIIPNPSGGIIRRSVFNEIGKFDVSLQIAADRMIWAKILLISNVGFVAEPLNYYRKLSGSSFDSRFMDTPRKQLNFEEQLKVFYYLSQRLNPPERFWEKQHQREDFWFWLTTHGKMPLSRSWRIYWLLKGINPKLNSRLLKVIFERIGKKLGLSFS